MDALIANRKLLPLVFSLVFFIVELVTLPSYGISWDETLHFRRGQAYFNYFLTGNLDYYGIPNVNLQGTKGDPKNTPLPRRSIYQSNNYTARFLLKNDSGHPPINGELAALTNYIFFQKLGILDDISSHHLFNIIASTLLVFVVVSFVFATFGVFPAIISFLSLSTYPLFFSEAHFNIKDPPEAAFFAATIWGFYKFINNNSARWLICVFIFFTLGLGTKFNILFVPLILIPFVLIRYREALKFPRNIYKFLFSKYNLWILGGLVFSGSVFFLSWPYLWQDVPNNLLNIFGYYKEIGTGTRYQPESFYVKGFNTFPLQWVLYTTPPLVLILFIFGILSLWSSKNKQKIVTLLWILWFVVSLARASLPGTVIYGGIRQVMEFLPAMVMLAGIGGWQIIEWLRSSFQLTGRAIFLSKVTLIFVFVWPLLVIIKMYPNENVYFNSLIGGLSGASQKNFPSWGNSFGNAYFQGIKWINENVEDGSKLSLIQGTTANLPVILLRSDIDYRNTNWSGIERGGEYLMDLTFNDTSRDYYYAWEYVDKFLKPVYELKVDGVSILKIWKNDLLHTKPEFQKQEKEYKGDLILEKSDKSLIISLQQQVLLSRLNLIYPNNNCLLMTPIVVETSIDDGAWSKEKDVLPSTQVYRESNISENEMTFFFAARKARYMRLTFDNTKTCELEKADARVMILE